MIKYRTRPWINSIDKVECTRETEHSVWVMREGFSGVERERREAKDCDSCQYHDSWEGAHLFLMRKAGDEIKDAVRKLEVALKKLKEVSELKEKTCTGG